MSNNWINQINFYSKDKYMNSIWEFRDIYWKKKLSPERHIEVMWNEARKQIFWENTISLREKKLLQKFLWTYWMTKSLFQESSRNSWERYFDHLLRVAYSILYKSNKPTLRKFLIAMRHDWIEDTNKDFIWLAQDIWEDISLWVLLISKPPFADFIDNETDKNDFNTVKSSWILNRKWTLRDSFKVKLKWWEKLRNREKNALKIYNQLELKYKWVRNDVYFSHMSNLYAFFTHARKLISKHKIHIEVPIEISDENEAFERENIINQICYDALEVKFFDRIDNLSTTEVYWNFNESNIRKAKRKIEETKKYFYWISIEFDEIHWTNFFEQIVNQVESLEKYIADASYRNVIDESRNKIKKIIESMSISDDENPFPHTLPRYAHLVSPWLII